MLLVYATEVYDVLQSHAPSEVFQELREGTYRELGHDGLELGRGEDTSVAEIL
jgi:hypothetical protein